MIEEKTLVAEDASQYLNPAEWIIVFEKFIDGTPFMRALQFCCIAPNGNGVIAFDSDLIYPCLIRCADVDNWHSTAIKNHILDILDGKLYKKYSDFEITPMMTGK